MHDLLLLLPYDLSSIFSSGLAFATSRTGRGEERDYRHKKFRSTVIKCRVKGITSISTAEREQVGQNTEKLD